MHIPDITINTTMEPGARLPAYATDGAAGADVYAYLPDKSVTLEPGGYTMIPTGLRMEIPHGYEVQVRPRSGLAAKHGVTVLNAPGTIDSDYRGEVRVILINHGSVPFTVNHEERIAQLVVSRTTASLFRAAGSISDTARGEGGFGSTGIS